MVGCVRVQMLRMCLVCDSDSKVLNASTFEHCNAKGVRGIDLFVVSCIILSFFYLGPHSPLSCLCAQIGNAI